MTAGNAPSSVPTPEDLAFIRERLGREPRGLRAVAWRDGYGLPGVVRVASVVDGKPFPTLFWLLDPVLCLRIDREEAGGAIALLQHRVDADQALCESMHRDHEAHIALRERFLAPGERRQLEDSGRMAALTERGIGGIADFQRIRCLHTWYAAHLVVPNTIGRLVDGIWAESGG
ncbi:MAG: DUF501 domain-containing protein [Halieaceae bacterium]|nr:DUF501 domain-containing protein [Halieaceae bacterium]